MNKKVSAYFLSAEYMEEALLVDTKIKGSPYYADEIMENEDKDSGMKLLFQINFDEMADLHAMPSTGILQIFYNGKKDFYHKSGLYGDDMFKVRYYASVNYEKDEPADSESEYDNTMFCSLESNRYFGAGITMEIFGECDYAYLGNKNNPGIIFGGSIYRDSFSDENHQILCRYPQYDFPLLRINSSEIGSPETYYFLVRTEDFEKRNFSKVLFLVENDEF